MPERAVFGLINSPNNYSNNSHIGIGTGVKELTDWKLPHVEVDAGLECPRCPNYQRPWKSRSSLVCGKDQPSGPGNGRRHCPVTGSVGGRRPYCCVGAGYVGQP